MLFSLCVLTLALTTKVLKQAPQAYYYALGYKLYVHAFALKFWRNAVQEQSCWCGLARRTAEKISTSEVKPSFIRTNEKWLCITMCKFDGLEYAPHVEQDCYLLVM